MLGRVHELDQPQVHHDVVGIAPVPQLPEGR
jgi:hypothetical protein